MSQMDNGAPRRIRFGGVAAAAVLMLGLYAAPAAAQDSTQVDKDSAAADTSAYAPGAQGQVQAGAEAQAGAVAAAAGQFNVELKSVASSGISGSAVLSADDDETDLEITLRDTAGNDREYDVTLRAGTCDAPGEVVEKVDDIEADGDPDDEEVDIQLAAIAATPHIIHVAQEGGDAAVACGEVSTK